MPTTEQPADKNQQQAKPKVEENKPQETTKPISNPVLKAVDTTPTEKDWQHACDHIDKVTENLRKYEGLKGHNCFMYYNQKIGPLVDRYKKGERSIALLESMSSAKIEAPTIDKVEVPISGVVGGLPPKK